MQAFQAVKEAGGVPGGLNISMCLVVDKASIASIADNEPLPFVMAVYGRPYRAN